MSRIGYVNIDQSKLDFGNFIAAFGILLSRIKVLHEEVYGDYIQYLAESEYFELIEEDEETPHYDIKFIIEPVLDVFFEKRSPYVFPLIRRAGYKIVSSSLVSVQPMQPPSGTLFYLNYKITTKTNAISNKTITQSSSNKTSRSRGKDVWEYIGSRPWKRKTDGRKDLSCRSGFIHNDRKPNPYVR